MWLYLLALCIFLKLFVMFTTGWCRDRKVMIGKVVIVTGANSGIGFETALNLAERGARVILACRNDQRGTQAANDIISKTGNKNVVYKNLDLLSLQSVRNFVKDIKSSEKHLDVLVNNAAGTGFGKRKTQDGIIEEMQSNHFAPFLLTLLLVPLLKKADQGRVVVVSSISHFIGCIDFDKINEPTESSGYWTMLRLYANSKLCNILFSNELARRLQGSAVTVNSLHPGLIRTAIYRNLAPHLEALVNALHSLLFKNAEAGAQTTIYLAMSDEVRYVTGRYFVDCKESWMSPRAKDEQLAAKLWAFSEKLVGLTPEEAI